MFFIVNSVHKPPSAFLNFASIPGIAVNLWSRHEAKSYSKWFARRPVGIVNQDELYEDPNRETNRALRIPRKRKTKEIIEGLAESATASNFGRQQSKFKISEPPEQLISKLILQVRKRNNKKNLILLEGVHLIRDSITAGVKPRTLIFTKKTSEVVKLLDLAHDVDLYQTKYEHLKIWSALPTCPGIMGIFDKPNLSEIEPAVDALPLTVICDNVRDPRNLGMIIRTVAAAGCKKIILLDGCVDLWNAKVQRCAAAAQFRVPIETELTWSDVSQIVNPDVNVLIADSNTYTTFDEIQPKCRSEDEQLEKKSESDTEPNIPNERESNTDDKVKTVELNEDSCELKDSSKTSWVIKETTHSDQQKRALKKFLSQLPINVCYYVDYTQKENVLIVCGETASYSFDLQKFMLGKNGMRLHVPLCNDVDSLSTPMALGIMVYEIRRQHLMNTS